MRKILDDINRFYLSSEENIHEIDEKMGKEIEVLQQQYLR